MRTVLVSNDDGPNSPGLRALLLSLKKLFDEVVFVVPEAPRSAASMSLTFHKPVRVWDHVIEGVKGYIISGSPADAVLVGLLKLLNKKPCAVVSGVNIGDNTGLQDIYASGTVAAAIQAAIMGVYSVAFSIEVTEERYLLDPTNAKGPFDIAADYAGAISRLVCDRGLPAGVQLLNVNFPKQISKPAEIRLTRPAANKYKNYVVERLDPRGKPYYWIWGSRLSEYESGTDVHAVFVERAISVTPLDIRLVPQTHQEELLSFMKDLDKLVKAYGDEEKSSRENNQGKRPLVG